MPEVKKGLLEHSPFADEYEDGIKNIKNSMYDSERDWDIEITMSDIHGHVYDILLNSFASFVKEEVIAEGRMYMSPCGPTLSDLTLEEMQKVVGKNNLPEKYKNFLLHESKKVLIALVYTMFYKFGDNDGEEAKEAEEDHHYGGS